MSLKIDRLGLGDEVRKLHSEGLGLRQIAEIINNDYNTKLSHMAIHRYLKRESPLDSTMRYGLTATFKSQSDRDMVVHLIKRLSGVVEYETPI